MLLYFDLESKYEIYNSTEKVSSRLRNSIIAVQESLKRQGIDFEDDDRVIPFSSLEEKIAVHNAALKRFELNERAFEYLHTDYSALMTELLEGESLPTQSFLISEMIRLQHHADRIRKKFSNTSTNPNGQDMKQQKMTGGKPKKELQNAKRDARLYELACDPENYPNWADVLAVIDKEFSGHQIEKDAANAAAKRYAEKHNLPPPPSRKPGRPLQR